MGTRLRIWGVLMSLFIVVQQTSAQEFQSFRGRIDSETSFQEYKVVVYEPGGTVVVDIRPMPGDDGGNLDTLLYLVDESGNIVAENDDRVRKVDTSSRIEFPEASVGQYTVIATRYGVDKGKTEGNYSLSVQTLSASRANRVRLDYDVSPEALLEAGYPETVQRPESLWTIFVYYGGDNNLEPGILNDYYEFKRAGGTSASVRVIAIVDVKSENKARLYDMTDLTLDDLDAGKIAEFDSYESGDGLSLAQFLVWGVRNYPAKRYVVAMASHGAGWRGIITDDPDEGAIGAKYDILSLPELQAAYRLALTETNGRRFDLLINDACLMSSVEYHHAMSEFFDYSLASPEIVINPALDMTLFTNVLKTNTLSNIPNIGEALVEAYINRDVLLRPTSDIVYFTSALTNLRQYEGVYQAVESFAALVNKNPGNYSAVLSDIRNNAYVYTAFSGDDQLIDMGNLMLRIVQSASDPDLIVAAQGVITALEGVFVYGNAGQVARTSVNNYQNIYFPSSSKVFDAKYFAESGLPNWGNMLRNFYNSVTPNPWSTDPNAIGFHSAAIPDIRIYETFPSTENTVSTYTPFISKIEILSRNLSYVNATIDLVQPNGAALRFLDQRILTAREVDGRIQRVNQWQNGVATSEGAWDVTLPFVSIGGRGNFELLRVSEAVASMEGRYREPDSETWNEVSIIFNINEAGSGGVYQRVINRSAETGALADITIPAGSTFQSYISIVTPDGRTITDVGNAYEWSEEPPVWQWSPAPSGKYNVGFLATASGGSTGFDSVEVTVDNSTSNPDLRSYTNTFLLVSVARPNEWTSFTEFFNEGFIRSLSPDGNSNVTIYNTYDVPDGNLQDIVDSIVQSYGLTETSARQNTTVDSKPAIAFNYSYEVSNGLMRGRGIATAHDLGGFIVGYLISTESLEGRNIILDTVRDSIIFYEPVAFCETQECIQQWNVMVDVENAFYPIFNTWAIPESANGWVRYSQNADPNSLTFVAVSSSETTEPSPELVAFELIERNLGNSLGNLSIVERRRFTAKYATWSAIIFSGFRGNVPVYGRMYVTLKDNVAYAIWAETPSDENTPSVIATFVEPIVDAFQLQN